MPFPKSYEEIKNGVPFIIDYEEIDLTLNKRKKLKTKAGTMNLACCDCGLVHQIVIIPSKYKIKIIMERDNRRTGQARRYVNYPCK